MPHISEKFSATYGGTRENFIVKAFSPTQVKIPPDVLKVFCVVQNILQRGSVTKPSVFLTAALGEPSAAERTYLIDKTRIIWNNIKGDDAAGNYPARTFYNELLEKHLGDFFFVRNLILPETDFAEILTTNRNFDGQQVDFCFPQMKFVFEIDGASHETSEQKTKDDARDKILKGEGITVEQINTTDIYNETPRFKNVMKFFLEKLRQNETINLYCAALKISPPNDKKALRWIFACSDVTPTKTSTPKTLFTFARIIFPPKIISALPPPSRLNTNSRPKMTPLLNSC